MDKWKLFGKVCKDSLDARTPEICKDFSKRGYTTLTLPHADEKSVAAAPPVGSAEARRPPPARRTAPAPATRHAPRATRHASHRRRHVRVCCRLCSGRLSWGSCWRRCSRWKRAAWRRWRRRAVARTRTRRPVALQSQPTAPRRARHRVPSHARAGVRPQDAATAKATAEAAAAARAPEGAECDAFIKAAGSRRHVLLQEKSSALLVGAILRSEAAHDVLAWFLGKRAARSRTHTARPRVALAQ